MLTITRSQIIDTLHTLGLQQGDHALVHAALQRLGRPEQGVQTYIDAFTEVLDLPERGTLAVPTFSFSFGRGERFDPASTPSQGMGVFAETLRQHPGACRSSHPMQSMAAYGRLAVDWCRRDTSSAFDPGSPFDALVRAQAWLVLLGADVQAASLVHLSEQRAHVPYRYWKEFHGEMPSPQGWRMQSYRMYVRDQMLNPQLILSPVQERLQAKGQWHSQPLGYGQVSICRARDFVIAADELLAADPWALVSNRPPEKHSHD